METKKSYNLRNVQLTLNEVDNWDELRDYIKGKPQFQYGIATLEKAPTTGHEHIHFYVQFRKATELTVSKLAGAHVEPCRGSAQQNIEYIRKTKEPEKAGKIIFEEGEPKFKGGVSIKDVKAMAPQDREQLPLVYYNIVNKINQEEAKDIKVDEFHKEVKVIYIHGPSGIGKTKKAIEIIKEAGYETFNLVKYDGSFWHGVKEQAGAALYDDFRDSHMKPSEFVNFIDYNIQIMNTKGSSIKNKYTLILITSVQDPMGIYANVSEEPRKQWLRRISETIEMQEADPDIRP